MVLPKCCGFLPLNAFAIRVISFHLGCINFLVDGVIRQQLLVGAHGVNFAVIQNHDHVGIHHRGDALGNDELGYIGQGGQRMADLAHVLLRHIR